MDFLQGLGNLTNLTRTENGAVTHRTTQSDVLDLFAQGSALRSRTDEDIIRLFTKAFCENPLLALKTLFYIRDVRGGQGERETFRIIIRHLAEKQTEVLLNNIHLIPYYGRWDDLLVLLDTPVEKQVFDMIANQLYQDSTSGNPSLLAKWLPSENTSSEETKIIAKKVRKGLKLTSQQYRKLLSDLRKMIKLVEHKVSVKDYSLIEYDKVPSGAMLKYRKAFERHDSEKYHQYLEAVANGDKKINTGTLFPYELVRKAMSVGSSMEKKTLNTLWDNLPDYLDGAESRDLCVIDTSGSMTWNNEGLPIYNAIALGMYIAERNKSVFHNHFITFDSSPQILNIKGETFCDRVNYVRQADWGGSTNLEATFDIILNVALHYKLPQSELPNRLFIISDMEFDSARCGRYEYGTETLMQKIKTKFEAHGYKLPKLVFWNVNSRQDNIPMTDDEAMVQLVSGSSPSIMEHLIKGETLTAYSLMLKVIESPRYDKISL